MTSPSGVLRASRIALLALFVAPLALAHAGPPEEVYDPLELDLHAFPHPDGELREIEAEQGAIAFPAADPTLRYNITAPMPFSVQRGATVTVLVQAARPTPATDASGNGLEVALTRDGVAFATRQVPLTQVLLPDQPVSVDVRFEPLNERFAAGARLGFSVRALFPVVDDGTLSLLVGVQRTRIDLDSVRLARIADHGLWPADVILFELSGEAFRPAEQAFTIRATHDSASLDKLSGLRKERSWVVLRIDEPFDTAEREHERFDTDARREGAHVWRVGATELAGYPGVGVAVRVPTLGESLDVECVARCPDGGFRRAIALEADPGNSIVDDRGALIPPPRNTPPATVVDDPSTGPEKATPVGLLPLLAILVAALMLRRP